MTGPKKLPTNLVPNCWIKNKERSINKTTGTTGTSDNTKPKPSIADVTVIAGVMTPSARRALPPTMASTDKETVFLRMRPNNAKIPPSPWLSARSVMITYLNEVCNVKVQKIQEIPP